MRDVSIRPAAMRDAPLTRRSIVCALGGTAVAWPWAALAQQSGRMSRIGVLMGYPEGDRQAQSNAVALRAGLEALGWVEGRNIRFDYRWAGADAEKARAFARELVGLKPDLIVTSTNQVTGIVQQTTRSIPVVFAFVGDPVGSGFVASLAQPGGNLTGFANFDNSIGGKWLEIFKEVSPKARSVGFVYNPTAAPNVGFFHAALGAGESLAMKVYPLAVHDAADIERSIKFVAGESIGGLIVAPHATTLGNRALIIELAARHRLPAVYSDRYFVESGGLLAFGNNAADLFRRAGSYIDRILKGAHPANLSVQLPTKFELVVNLRTAKALGFALPPTLLSRADQVIE
jgi:putative ABC transport system substrate-binding protein